MTFCARPSASPRHLLRPGQAHQQPGGTDACGRAARPLGPALGLLLGLVLSTAAVTPAHAQYKVVRPDGSVAYTDRPPTTGNAQVTAIGRSEPATRPVANRPSGSAGTRLQLIPTTGFPLKLREAVTRYPVTLFSTSDCPSCDKGRQLLLQRGVPFIERRVLTDEDIMAFERQFNTRNLPTLTIGPQPMPGFSGNDWNNYLDAAGYPETSLLPKGWRAPEPSPLAARTQPAPPPTPDATEAAEAPPPVPAPAPESRRTGTTIRF